MSWNDYEQSSWKERIVDRLPLIGAAIAAILLLFLLAWALAKGTDNAASDLASAGSTNNESGSSSMSFTTTTTTTVAPLIPLESPEDIHHHEMEDYSTKPIPPSEYDEQFPPSESGLDTATYRAAVDFARGLVTADVTLQGRAQYPEYFPYAPPPTPLANPFVLDHLAPSTVRSHPSLIRVVAIWHGTSYAGVELKQVRRSYYLTKNSNGALRAIRPDDLPEAIRSSDGLLAGISITG